MPELTCKTPRCVLLDAINRTEFRSMEVQLTDLENAAFTVFVVLVTRVILAFDLNLYIPLSKVSCSNAHC
jgi:Glutamate-cysteine ligase